MTSNAMPCAEQGLETYGQFGSVPRLLRKVTVPEGKDGDFEIKRFEVSDDDAKFHNLREMLHSRRYITPGIYTSLTQRGYLWMSDTDAELSDHTSMTTNTKHYGGDILVMGLGLGAVVQAVLDLPQVTTCTVLEKYPEVIRLVEPHYRERYGSRFTVIETDALQWKAKRDYTVVWADIWATMCETNLPEIVKLRRRWSKHCKWFGAWAERLTKLLSTKSRRRSSRF
jgi:hypothetical protein